MKDSLPQSVQWADEHLFFVTGKLASRALTETVSELSAEKGFRFTIETLPITVAALMTPQWIAKRWHVPEQATRVILPGYCRGDLEPLRQATSLPLHRGPLDLRELPTWFGAPSTRSDDYGRYDIEIIAEINHAPQLSLRQLLTEADRLRQAGADRIDVGCEPTGPWAGVGEAVAALIEAGHCVSIDSLDPREIAPAVQAGASLVLSVNQSNRDAAPDWGCEVVVIPDDFANLGGLDDTLNFLTERGVPFRIDPILEPIGMGFTPSLKRYWDVRTRYPDAEIMMGIGNLTELTDVDSAGMNVLLLAICQELGVRSVLTTEVINWARSSVAECDVARRMTHFSINKGVVPKRLDERLVMLRDPRLIDVSNEQLDQLAEDIKDRDFRLFADGKALHLVGKQRHLTDVDPFELFDQLLRAGDDGAPPRNLDLSHAFYLGFELSKALTANTLGKQYRQDQALSWGLLTHEEVSHRDRKRKQRQAKPPEDVDARPADGDGDGDGEEEA